MTGRDRPTIEANGEIEVLAAFMAANIPTSRLVSVARAIGEIAPLLWGHYSAEEVAALRLVAPPILPADDSHRRSVASE